MGGRLSRIFVRAFSSAASDYILLCISTNTF